MADPKPDKLSKEQLASLYGYGLNVIYASDVLRPLFEEAVKNQWTEAQFQAKLRSSTWWQDNDQYARSYIVAKLAGGKDFETMQQTATAKVKAAATQVGLNWNSLSADQQQSLTDRYMSEGWGDPDRTGVMMEALGSEITTPPTGMLRGRAGNLEQTLRATAQDNGLTLDDNYYLSAAKSVAAGLSTDDDWIRDVRTQAASLFPLWSDKIMAGSDARTLASGYINTMAQTFEIDPNSINLDDPYLKQAFGAVGKDGLPQGMGLWDFQKMLRNDPRWMNTKQAQDQMSSAARDVLTTFGFMG